MEETRGFATADLCDEFGEGVRVAEPVFRNYGGASSFSGPVSTVRVFEDNVLVREALEEDGRGRVLVVDGGARRGAPWWEATSPRSPTRTAGRASSSMAASAIPPKYPLSPLG